MRQYLYIKTFVPFLQYGRTYKESAKFSIRPNVILSQKPDFRPFFRPAPISILDAPDIQC